MLCFRIVFYNKIKRDYKCVATYYRQFENKEQATEYADTFSYDSYKIRQIPVAVFLFYSK